MLSHYSVFIAGAVIRARADIAADEILHFIAVKVAYAGITLVFVIILKIYAILTARALYFFCHKHFLLLCAQSLNRVFSCRHFGRDKTGDKAEYYADYYEYNRARDRKVRRRAERCEIFEE